MPVQITADVLVSVLWIIWLAYWAACARDVKPTARSEPIRSRLWHRLPVIPAAFLLAAPRLLPRVLTRRFLPPSATWSVLGTLILAAGLALAVWARRHLGRNWSAHVVVKQGHTLIRTGPYRAVRHPIYSGILLAFVGTAIAAGEWRHLLAAALIALSLVLKSRGEEARMRETFPEYEQYRRETAALIPGVY
jgi:protein-S-isoprenylcysteine O-methyltransferase Ste14